MRHNGSMTTEEMLELIQQVSAEIVDPRFRKLASGDIDQKRPGDFVTVADREAEAALTEEIQRRVPGCLVVGEEATFLQPDIVDRLAGEGTVYLIDPVDGTRNFVNGSPDHAVMVAEVIGGETTRSWIWQPQHGHSYVAEHGAGVQGDGVQLAPRTADSIPQQPRGVTSKRSRLGFTAEGSLAPVESSAWCVGMDYPRIATGELDYLVYKSVKPWDHVPGALLVRELGGAVVHFSRDRYRPTSTTPGLVVAASPRTAELVVSGWQQP